MVAPNPDIPWSPWTGRIHCIGIGGAGMSAAARLLAARGVRVSGSDGAPSVVIRSLREAGITVAMGHRAEHVPPGTECVVRSLAVPDDNPEVQAAMARGLPVLTYPELVGRLMGEKIGVAVAGTHGKTTTSAMLAHTLVAGGADPSVLIGGALATLGGSGGRAGHGDAFVAEACEYRQAFLQLRPRMAVLTSVEPDHFDCYDGAPALEAAFGEFVSRLPRNGVLIANADDLAVMRVVVRSAACRVVTYGMTVPAAVHGTLGHHGGRGWRVALQHNGRPAGRLELPIPGRHNVSNALAAAAAALELGLPAASVCEGLASFPGVARRFEVVGEGHGVTVIDDYAHHPTAVRAVIAGARKRFPLRRIVAVFQPHQGSRTRNLMQPFAAALATADVTVLPEIFYAREGQAERERVSSRDLAAAVQRLGAPAFFIGDVARVVGEVAPMCRAGDVVLVMGAGDISGHAQRLVGALRAKALAASGLDRLAGGGLVLDERGLGRLTPSGRFEAVA